MPKVTIKIAVIAKRATVEFAPGLGVGVLSSQEATFDVPENCSQARLMMGAASAGDELLKDTVEVTYEVLR